jgi:hypothetical protein
MNTLSNDGCRLDEAAAERLVELEHKIGRGLKTFIEVGEALVEIRESKLYLLEHKTFAEYCLKNGTSRAGSLKCKWRAPKLPGNSCRRRTIVRLQS